jgi:hypothetical protein
MLFPNLPSSSKTLVFTASSFLSEAEAESFIMRLSTFICAWQSHGAGLSAASKLIANRVLIVAIDESGVSASGCSLDSLTHFLKAEAPTIDWFNRSHVLHRPHSDTPQALNDNWSVTDIAEFHALMKSKKLGDGAEVINTTVMTLASARLNLVEKASESWHAKMM